MIQSAVDSNEILLFMKGTPVAPACGFSAKTTEILDALLGKNYASVDVIAHPEVREGIKEFSSWPTIPQLYVKGKFLGGADIIEQLYQDGQLAEALGIQASPATPPEVHLTSKSQEALEGFLGDSGEVVLLEVDRQFQAGLSLGPEPKEGIGAAVLCNGKKAPIRVFMDRLTATRANGLKIDFVETPQGAAFKIDNPNEPAGITRLRRAH